MKWMLCCLLVTAACDDEATGSDAGVTSHGPCYGIRQGTVCQGDALVACAYTLDYPQGTEIGRTDCQPGMCRAGLLHCLARIGTGTGGTDPGCSAVSTASDSPEVGDPGYCDGSLDIGCEQSYAVSVHDCHTDLCRSDGTYAVCVTSTMPSAVCDSTGFYYRCNGTTSVFCLDDVIVRTQDCTQCASGTCV